MWDWITKNFNQFDAGLYLVYSDNESFVCINQEQCNSLFSGVLNVTYSGLCILPCTNQGWQKIFDDWKGRGLIQ